MSDSFGLQPDSLLAGKYIILERLGGGWEGEVYLVRERSTGIERSAKLFHPVRNPGNRTVRRYARKLHKLRHCPILVQYHTQEKVRIGDQTVTMLVSDFVEGERLSDFIRRQPGGKLDFFQGLHLLHDLAVGLEPIHRLKEYHGDIHDENIIIRRRGLSFQVRLLDMLAQDMSSTEAIKGDVRDLVRLLYDVLGGAKTYARHPAEIKSVCCGLKKSLIDRKFRTAGQLRTFLEELEWVTR